MTFATRNNLADALRAAGRNAEVLPLLEANLKAQEAKQGADHPNTLRGRLNLALAYQAAGRNAEVVPLCEAVLKAGKGKLEDEDPTIVLTHVLLATAHEALNRWAEAEGIRRELLARDRVREKPGSVRLSVDMSWLGVNLLKQEKASEAEPLLRECLAIREKAMPDDWQRFSAMSLLGGAMLGHGKYAAAEPLVVGGYEGMKARAAKIPAGSSSASPRRRSAS
jgi:hypothetical protein